MAIYFYETRKQLGKIFMEIRAEIALNSQKLKDFNHE